MDTVERINVWYDQAGDYLDVHWVAGHRGTYFTPTENERVDVLVDEESNLCGFFVWGLSKVNNGEAGFANFDLSPAAETETAPA